MKLHEQIHADLITAMKSGDQLRRDVLRMCEGAMKNDAIEKKKDIVDLTDEESVAVVKRLVKQRKDSASQFTDGGRDDLAQKENQEIEILATYLPAQASDDEIRTVVEKVITTVGATSQADMGKVMGLAMKALGSDADGNDVRRIVLEILV